MNHFRSRLIALAAAPVASAALNLSPAFAQSGPPDGWYHGPGMMWGYGGFGMFFGFFFMLLIVAAIVVAIVLALRAFGLLGDSNSVRSSSDGANRALDILKERFAKGEIDAKEFSERKRHLAD